MWESQLYWTPPLPTALYLLPLSPQVSTHGFYTPEQSLFFLSLYCVNILTWQWEEKLEVREVVPGKVAPDGPWATRGNQDVAQEPNRREEEVLITAWTRKTAIYVSITRTVWNGF